MPRDLFGNVTRPSVSVGNRKWYTVPVSLISHSLVLAVIVMVPILAAPLMPSVLGDNNLDFVMVKLPPPPPPPQPITAARHDPAPDPDAAPTSAPTGITREPERPPDIAVADMPGLVGGGDNLDHVLAPPPPVPPRPQPPAAVRPGGIIRSPVRTRGVDPVYPPVALAARIQGIVIIEATIGVDGHVVNARILRSVPLLDQAALDAVRQWEYTPTMLNGSPVPVIMSVTVSFTISR